MVGLGIDVAFQTFLPLSLKFLIDRAIEPRDARLLGWALSMLILGVAIAALAAVETVVVGALPNVVSGLLALVLLAIALFGLEARLAAVT